MRPLLASSVLRGNIRFIFCHTSNLSSSGMAGGLHTCHSVLVIVLVQHYTATLQEYTREDVQV